MSRASGQLASAAPGAPPATGRPDHVLVPVMLAARMLPTASTIDCPVLPHTWATKSVAISLVRAGETAAMRADVAVRELTSRMIHYVVLPLPREERAGGGERSEGDQRREGGPDEASKGNRVDDGGRRPALLGCGGPRRGRKSTRLNSRH